MRAISAKQRFPVPQWKADLEIMHDTAIKMSKKSIPVTKPSTPAGTRPTTPVHSFTNLAALWAPRRPSGAFASAGTTADNTRPSSPAGTDAGRMSMGRRAGPGHAIEQQGRGRHKLRKSRPTSRDSSAGVAVARKSIFSLSGKNSRASSVEPKGKDKDLPNLPPATLSAGQPPGTRISRISENLDETQTQPDKGALNSLNGVSQFDFSIGNPFEDEVGSRSVHDDSDAHSTSEDSKLDEYLLTPEQVENEREKLRVASLQRSLEANAGEGSSGRPQISRSPSLPGTPNAESGSLLHGRERPQTPSDVDFAPTAPREPYLSLGTVLQGKKDFKLQDVTPFFNDPTGLYADAFMFKLRKLNGKTSEGPLCIEDYLTKSEKDWFNRYRNVRLGKSAASSRASSIFRVGNEERNDSGSNDRPASEQSSNNEADQFLLQEGYQPPTGLKKFLLRRIGTWPLYTFLLAFVCDLSRTD